jgi:hypothetical protein
MHTKSEIFDSSPSNAHKINKKDIAIWHGQKELHDLNVVLTQSSRNAVLMPCDVVAYQVGRTSRLNSITLDGTTTSMRDLTMRSCAQSTPECRFDEQSMLSSSRRAHQLVVARSYGCVDGKVCVMRIFRADPR